MGCKFKVFIHLNKIKPIMLKKDKRTTEDHCKPKDECTVTEAV
jgi:hypothetical protein